MSHKKRRAIPQFDTTDGYRSGFERRIATDLKSRGVSFDYEPFKIPWTHIQKRTYMPDILFMENGIIVEAKGYFQSKDRTKHKALREQYPDLDLRFLFEKAKTKLNKLRPTTYGDWCTKHGFKFADGDSIPQAWLDEPAKPLGLPRSILERITGGVQ